MKKQLKMVQLSMLAALGVVLMLIVRFPLFPSAPFLEYDMGDVAVILTAFLYSPWASLLVLVIVSLIQALTVSASSGWIGFVMNVISTGAFVLVCGLIYNRKRGAKSKVSKLYLPAALAAGTIAMVLVMIPLNLIFTVRFMQVPREAVLNMMIPTIIPFNVLKGIINSVVVCVLYPAVKKILKSSKSLNPEL
ncbi:MAG TPA: ECF transporter S component [Clostridiales bacterium]|nr:ECF transporter S component [Clostridiales bacterium]